MPESHEEFSARPADLRQCVPSDADLPKTREEIREEENATDTASSGEYATLPGNSVLGRLSAQLNEEEFSWHNTVGGWRGLIESTLPGMVFVIVYVATRNMSFTLISALAMSLIACMLRLIQRQPLTQVFSGVAGVAIGVVWAVLSGRGENYFAVGLISAGAYLALIVLSILLGRSFVSIAMGAILNLEKGWRHREQYRRLLRTSNAVSWLWASVFAVRLGVQWPLWSMGKIAELGAAKLLLGLPLFAIAAWVTWIALRPYMVLRETR